MPSSDLGFYDINDYISSVTPARDPILTEMEDYGRKHNFPIVGPTVGSFLHQMVLLTNPKRIFEMGSGFGYTAYWMAKALNDPDAKIICTEGAPKNATCAMSYFERGGVAAKIDIKIVMDFDAKTKRAGQETGRRHWRHPRGAGEHPCVPIKS